MTNREKFKEVFGADPLQDGWGGYCPPPKMHKCSFATRECRQCMKWWELPYEIDGGDGGNSGSTTLRQTKDGNWVKAEPIPYYPNAFERVWLWIKALLEAPKGADMRGNDNERE